MPTIDRVHPQLQAALQLIPSPFLDLSDIPATRALIDQMMAMLAGMMPPPEGVTLSDHAAPGPAGAPDVAVRLYAPADRPDHPLPAYLWLHGGGYVLGRVAHNDAACAALASAVNCVVAAVEYRLAPEHPFPAALEDSYAALRWLAANAGALGIDPARIAIGGNSAGGGLAAGLALYARDRAEVAVCFQLLVYPMLDDRSATPSAQLADTPIWTRADNLRGWHAYLGRPGGGDDVSPYAAPARAADLRGLPPAYLPVGDCDLFLDENIDYARRLLQAGVPTELHVYPGAFHGFDGLAAGSALARRFLAEQTAVLRAALHGS